MSWRNTSRDVTVLGFDAWALVPFLLVPLLSYNWWAIYFAIASALASWVMRRAGLGVVGAARRVRAWWAGKRRPAVPSWKRRGFA